MNGELLNGFWFAIYMGGFFLGAWAICKYFDGAL